VKELGLTTARQRLGAVFAAVGLATLLAACGETPTVQEAASSPLTSGKLAITLTGDDVITIADPNRDVTVGLDEARLVVIHVTVRSTTSVPETVTIRASLFDKDGTLVGDATGGALNIQPGATVTFSLSGPTPTGVIDHATFERHATPGVATPS